MGFEMNPVTAALWPNIKIFQRPMFWCGRLARVAEGFFWAFLGFEFGVSRILVLGTQLVANEVAIQKHCVGDRHSFPLQKKAAKQVEDETSFICHPRRSRFLYGEDSISIICCPYTGDYARPVSLIRVVSISKYSNTRVKIASEDDVDEERRIHVATGGVARPPWRLSSHRHGQLMAPNEFVDILPDAPMRPRLFAADNSSHCQVAAGPKVLL